MIQRNVNCTERLEHSHTDQVRDCNGIGDQKATIIKLWSLSNATEAWKSLSSDIQVNILYEKPQL